MALKTYHVQRLVRHTLGGSDLPTSLGFGYIDLANRVGEWMCSMHGWRWLDRPQTTVQIQKNVGYVDLPTDFGEMKALPRFWGTEERPAVQLTTYQAILDARNYGSVATPMQYSYIGAVVFDEPWTTPSNASTLSEPVFDPPTTAGVVRPRLELWPTPQQDDTLWISYRATWVRVADDEDSLSLPEWLEPLYLELCREFARGYVFEDVATLSERLAPYTRKSGGVFQHPLVAAAVGRDARSQVDRGPMSGGHVARTLGRAVAWYAGTVGDPQ